MVRLEELTRSAVIAGVLPNEHISVIDVEWHGSDAVTLVYRDSRGQTGNELLLRDDEPRLDIVTAGRPWSFDSDGRHFRLASEAKRIQLAHLFDPLLAVHASIIEPLPHQITAVYQEMLARQPLRFLLADDPGSGKTIMAGLLIKELLMRGDLARCLIICPGSLVEQWQDELNTKFNLPFEILTRDKIESSRTGNWFIENHLAIARLDQLARNDELQDQLKQTDWDLIVVDEAHKMSASYFGGEVSYTKRYQLGRLAGSICRHFLLMTATPHNGKEEDFQLFMALLDADRFEGRFRDGVHSIDASDLMRRLLKENLLKFDGKRLFPERRAYTVPYTLSDREAQLYIEVTDYVRNEFNRADQLEPGGRKGTVGFALMILQRRLASSPEAIYQSLRRRRMRLESRLREVQIERRGDQVTLDILDQLPDFNEDDIDDFDDLPGDEAAEAEDLIVDLATASRTINELEAEITILKRLEEMADDVRRSGTDRKWEELSALVQGRDAFGKPGERPKLVIFTEHRDTLDYLTNRLETLLGREDAIVTIHGGMGREQRRRAQELFTQDRSVEILAATDAAGEGINLQRAHLMVNYDLPWNPNRLEQRFGRIHRIGQTEVCHLWNLVATETREGDVFYTLLEKLERERKALDDQVFDVLGQLTFENKPLRQLLVEAIRYGERDDVRNQLHKVVDQALDTDHLKELIATRSLVSDVMNVAMVREIREEMERANARRLQPHYIEDFFLEAFRELGGRIYQREPGRWEVTRVPGILRERDRLVGRREPLLRRYERVAFEKQLLQLPGKPLAEFIAPGHPLLDMTVSVILERYGQYIKRGAVLVDESDEGEEIRALVYLEHAIQDARTDADGNRRTISTQMQFVEIDETGEIRGAGYAPYLDYRPVTDREYDILSADLEAEWLSRDLEREARNYAISEIVPAHRDEVRQRREVLVEKARNAVHERLTREIMFWDRQAIELRQQEEAGKRPKLNSTLARQRATDLTERLDRRMRELEQERQISALPPVVVGGALIVPAGLLRELSEDEAESQIVIDVAARRRIERLAMAAVMAHEEQLGNQPVDVSRQNYGWDVESRDPANDRLRFIEVKGRAPGSSTVTVTKNEILAAFNKGSDFILAIVFVEGDTADRLFHLVQPFTTRPDFNATAVTYDLNSLLSADKLSAVGGRGGCGI